MSIGFQVYIKSFVVETVKSESATLIVEYTALFPLVGHSAEEDERAVDPGPAQPRLRRHQDHEQQPQLPDHLRATGRERASSFFWCIFYFLWGYEGVSYPLPYSVLPTTV